MKAGSLSMRAGLPRVALVALVALVAFQRAARADVAPPELNGCARRPEGAVCYVKGVERGVCVKRPGEPRECLVADPKDAPPPPSTPDPPPNAEADAAPPSRWTCAARAPGEGDSSEVAILAAFVVMALAAARRARSSPAR